MKKNKIFIKLFAMTAGVVIILLLIQFVVQYFWLEEFYVYNKKKTIGNDLITLKKKIEENLVGREKIEEFLNRYSIENDVFIGIFDRQGMPQYGLSGEDSLSYIQMKDDKTGVYKIYMDAFSRNDELIKALKIDKSVNVKGLLRDSGQKEVYPQSVIVENREFSVQNYKEIPIESEIIIDDPEGNDLIAMEDIEDFAVTIEIVEAEDINLNGSIVDMNLISKENYGTYYRREQLLQETFLFLGQEKNLNIIFKDNKIMNYIKIDPFTGIKNIIFVQPILVRNNEPMFMFAVSSLQPIEKTTEIMETYFIFVLITAMILAIIAAYFYSKKITAPLIHLNGITKNLAKLDFSQNCKVETNDEIEDLAENINSMSEKLKKTLKELKKSNEKLKEDILFKEKIEEFRKRFIADASHELKTPLTVIKGICEGVEDGIYDYKDKEHFKNILREINDMSQLVYDLLGISKLEADEVPFKKDVFQLCDVVLKVHNKLKPILENKNLEVELDLTEDFVLGDEDKIERVIGNLYYNAIQYTPENGEINIYIHTIENKSYFNIENKPAKIPKDDLMKIWEPFYRVEKSRNKALGGSGLGLYMVKEILDRHSSQYGIENTDVGVKAYFSLEIKMDDDEEWS